MEKKDVVIVGGGLAGLSLAYHLLKYTKNILLIDKGVNYSSRVAAGMINPLVFRRMTKSWRVDEFIPYLTQFYAEVESLSGASFHHPIEMRRLFSSEQERNFWLEKQEAFSNYMWPINEADTNYTSVKNQFGSGRVKAASHINTAVFLNALSTYLKTQITVLESEFDYQLLKEKSYDNYSFEHLVFCEGYLGADNPYFSNLHLQQTKGETLLLKSNSIPETESLNRKCFVLPLGNKHFKIGSTYVWNSTDLNTTEEGRTTLLHNLSYLTDESVEIVEQEAGIRPTTEDRRPLMGTHPEIKHLHIFNGLGTKGYMSSPLLAKELAAYLINGEEIHPEARITRFQK
jgi:glycine/D-amino acid oxidase-like deaminating enzyme